MPVDHRIPKTPEYSVPSPGYRIPVPRMTDSIVVKDNRYVYLATGARSIYMFDHARTPLGSGGMGTVYYGFDCRTGIPVAIKQLHPNLCSIPWLRECCRRESALAFSHPNIVEMLGCAEFRNQRGPIFVVSKYVPGKNMEEFLSAGIISNRADERPERIVRLLLPILDALEFLHSQRLCHMDIKPTNIMVDNFSVVRLMDLGMATHNVDTAGGFGDEFGVMGTPGYAAPEQFLVPGHQARIDGRSDIYQMAVTIYKLICGDNPYTGESLEHSFRLHRSGSLPENMQLSDRLHAVLAKATVPLPEGRYQNVAEFRAALTDAITPRKKSRFWPFSR